MYYKPRQKSPCIREYAGGLLRSNTSSESFKQAVRGKLYIVNEMNKALEAIGAQNGADDVINIGDHVTY